MPQVTADFKTQMLLQRRAGASTLQHLLRQKLLDGESDQLEPDVEQERMRPVELPVGRRRHAAVQADRTAQLLASVQVSRLQKLFTTVSYDFSKYERVFFPG